MRRVLVTGGGGFLGSRLVKRLAGEGHDVIVARRRDGSGAEVAAEA